MRIEVPYQHYVIRIFIYLNHTNIAWGSKNRINLKRLLTHQKYAIQVINNQVRFDHNAELFKSHEMLNIFEFKYFLCTKSIQTQLQLHFMNFLNEPHISTQQRFRNLTMFNIYFFY